MVRKIKAQHILVEHEYEAKDILRKLDRGDSFEDLAKHFSICSSSKNGGLLGEFGRGKMNAVFEKAAFSLAVGEVSLPVRTKFGHHIIKRLA